MARSHTPPHPNTDPAAPRRGVAPLLRSLGFALLLLLFLLLLSLLFLPAAAAL